MFDALPLLQLFKAARRPEADLKGYLSVCPSRTYTAAGGPGSQCNRIDELAIHQIDFGTRRMPYIRQTTPAADVGLSLHEDNGDINIPVVAGELTCGL